MFILSLFIIFIIYFSNSNVKSFKILRYNKENSAGRIVNFYIDSVQFKYSCKYMPNSGFICCHIFRVGIQLNLNKLPTELYLHRWRKNPTDNIIFEYYKNFYSNMPSNMILLEQNHQ